jgi:PAS domain S-box-containing protein
VVTKLSFFSPRTGFLTGPPAYALTLAATGLAALVTIVGAPILTSTPFIVVTLAVIVSSWFAGFRHGLIPVIVGATVVNYYLLPPQNQWSLDATGLRRTVLWTVFAAGLAWLLSRLRKSEDRARTILESITEGFLILDRNWTLLHANQAGAQFVDKSKQEVMGQNFWEVMPQIAGRPTEQHLRRCAAERVPVQFESYCGRRQKWLHIRAYPFPGGMSLFFRDISDTKIKEEAQRTVLERLSTAHKAAQMGTWDWNIKTSDLIWSDEIPRIHGLTPEQFDGKVETWIKTIHPDDLPGVQAKIQKALEDRQEYYAEFRVVWPNGETHWICGHGKVIADEQGAPARMIGIGADITHHHLEEEALRRSEKLATAGRLAATIAHEINNPLEAVTNLLYLVRQDSSLSRETLALLRATDDQLSRVNHIARQTLGFYRDRNTPETVDVAQVMEELLTIFQARLATRQICVVKEYERVGAITAFRGELRQVLSNLITNAIDASTFGSQLVLRIKPETSAPANALPLVRIEVEDFGSGIRPAEMTRIFEPFFTTKSDVGTGLGLWVSKQIVEKNGGQIDFRTRCDDGNSGTCFSVVMPTANAAAA